MSTGNERLVIYAVARDVIVGEHPPVPELGQAPPLEWYDTVRPEPVLSKREIEHILWQRCVPHHTYSMQQSDFARQGFEVDRFVHLPENTLVVGLKTRDRYDIFAPVDGLEVITYESVEDWRRERDYEAEGWTHPIRVAADDPRWAGSRVR